MQSDYEKIRTELKKLASTDRLTPENVVDTAKKESSPLHSCFEWIDSVAAHNYRLDQARRLISGFEIVVRNSVREINVQQFVHDVRRGNEQGYVEFTAIKKDKDRAREFMDHELSVAQSYIERAAAFAKALGFTKEVEELSESIASLREQVLPQQAAM